jgi:hypothetical protein
MRIIVNSRIFNLTADQEDAKCSFVPFADMINHSNSPNCDWSYDDDKKAFVMIANKDICEGEELVDSYGRKTNFKFFLHYGFINQDPNLVDEDICLTLQLDSQDPLYDTKAKILDKSML